MKSLDRIMVEHESDKASVFTRTYAKPHDYCRHLERFFEPLRERPIKLLEIGVGGGESIRAWLEYFVNPQVFGVDLVANTNPWNSPKEKPHPRYTFVHGDQSNAVFWKSFVKIHGGDWDIIDDDGSHISEHIRTTFKCLWPVVKSGGIYVIEDLKSAPEAASWVSGIARDAFDGVGDCDSACFARELAILIKK